MFFIMITANSVLLCVMRERKKLAQQGHISSIYDFKKESCTVKITLFLFGFGYLYRFFWDIYLAGALEEKKFATEICFDLALYIEVLPFISLLLLHFKNFKQSKHHSNRSKYSPQSLITENNEDILYLEPANTTREESRNFSVQSSPPRFSFESIKASVR